MTIKYQAALNLYLVSQGEAVRADGTEKVDGTESVFAAAPTSAAALQLAAEYDEGLRQPDNYEVSPGCVVGALRRSEDEYSHVARSPRRQVNLGFYSLDDALEQVAAWDHEDGEKSPRDLNANNEVVAWEDWVELVKASDEDGYWPSAPIEALDNYRPDISQV
ncbi:hypothetical protein [Acidihalobacter aeolianus]|uniref:hypothetical protein n=1 Tax=Acidihalobacter aeolianus TaxID=2792603 RepID=UPI0012EB03DE|nr:hypothetical protein [Acidihalobacter aeolianus]